MADEDLAPSPTSDFKKGALTYGLEYRSYRTRSPGVGQIER